MAGSHIGVRREGEKGRDDSLSRNILTHRALPMKWGKSPKVWLPPTRAFAGCLRHVPDHSDEHIGQIPCPQARLGRDRGFVLWSRWGLAGSESILPECQDVFELDFEIRRQVPPLVKVVGIAQHLNACMPAEAIGG